MSPRHSRHDRRDALMRVEDAFVVVAYFTLLGDDHLEDLIDGIVQGHAPPSLQP